MRLSVFENPQVIARCKEAAIHLATAVKANSMTSMPPQRYALAPPAPLCLPLSAHAQRPDLPLNPVGGGYERALKGYAAEAIRHARGLVVHIVLIPAAFGNDPFRPAGQETLAGEVAVLPRSEHCELACHKAAIDVLTASSRQTAAGRPAWRTVI